jgi:hypothetical protein
MYVIWAIPIPFALTVLIAAFSTGTVTTVETTDADTNQSCTFNHNTITGIVLDLATFQGPLLVTIIVNCYSYTKGLLALSNTPHSVVARQMRKAGGYLGVLLLVWVPNIVYNFMSIFSGGNDDQYSAFLDMVIFLSSLQGFLNVCVYVWSNQQMRSWFMRHLFCVVWCRKTNPTDQITADTTTNRPSAGASNKNPLYGEEECSDNEDDEEADRVDGLRDSLAFGGHLRGSDRNTLGSSGASTVGSGSGRDTNSSGGSKNSKTKSILIPSAASKVVDKKKKSTQMAQSADLDNERYVRFGE